MIKVNTVITAVLQTGQPHFKVILWISLTFFFSAVLSSKSHSGRPVITVLLFACLFHLHQCLVSLSRAFMFFSNFNLGTRTSLIHFSAASSVLQHSAHIHTPTLIWYKGSLDSTPCCIGVIQSRLKTSKNQNKKNYITNSSCRDLKTWFSIISSSYQDLYVLIPTFVSLLLSGFF